MDAEINNKTSRTFCIIGDPIEHSLSPLMHNAAFKKLNLNYSYIAFRVPSTELSESVESLKRIQIAGFNVTIPHKVNILKFLDDLDNDAQLAGAVNTVKNENGSLIGYNTDIYGIINPLENKISDFNGLKILILGAGGSCRAAIIGLSRKKGIKKIAIFNRDKNRLNEAISLGNKVGIDCYPYDYSDSTKLYEVSKSSDMVLNTTSVGMKGELSPIEASYITANTIVFDIVYKPIHTGLLLSAKKANARLIYGYEMLLNQGYKAFEIWTGLEAPRDTMKKTLFGIFGEP
ncbi:MAG: shikimate dehydrogenase [Candidatus Nitrosocosmicus sp.]|uniref:shikimate dehydrogenase n=1 Tax=Candidatus Nitrosocosmicus agrestis TaxID=2563600 RepID=UPI001E4889C6|nr:shikimate dehydrogenase [Candidatus Nitrosocosmicus sp. SS]MDR4491453.1 shikimate dehydrogenase [Candidatus Nitrosocosmicus sp.]